MTRDDYKVSLPMETRGIMTRRNAVDMNDEKILDSYLTALLVFLMVAF
jgi:hypothetical protein